MSLDNTSQPSVKYCADKVDSKYTHGSPVPELVPSRYALTPSGLRNLNSCSPSVQFNQRECQFINWL